MAKIRSNLAAQAFIAVSALITMIIAAPLSQLDDGERAQRRECVVLRIVRR